MFANTLPFRLVEFRLVFVTADTGKASKRVGRRKTLKWCP